MGPAVSVDWRNYLNKWLLVGGSTVRHFLFLWKRSTKLNVFIRAAYQDYRPIYELCMCGVRIESVKSDFLFLNRKTQKNICRQVCCVSTYETTTMVTDELPSLNYPVCGKF
jgi:hypothetical protein